MVLAPVTEQLLPLEAEQLRVVPVMLPEVPARTVTVISADCCDSTSNRERVQWRGTHESTEAVSVALAFGVFTA